MIKVHEKNMICSHELVELILWNAAVDVIP